MTTSTSATLLVINLNSRTMFELHRPGCRDVTQARRRGLTVLDFADQSGSTSQRIANLLYEGDPMSVSDADWRSMPCR